MYRKKDQDQQELKVKEDDRPLWLTTVNYNKIKRDEIMNSCKSIIESKITIITAV